MLNTALFRRTGRSVSLRSVKQGVITHLDAPLLAPDAAVPRLGQTKPLFLCRTRLHARHPKGEMFGDQLRRGEEAGDGSAGAAGLLRVFTCLTWRGRPGLVEPCVRRSDNGCLDGMNVRLRDAALEAWRPGKLGISSHGTPKAFAITPRCIYISLRLSPIRRTCQGQLVVRC
jgi:hypothetical protein